MIAEFKYPYRWLSNFEPVDILYNGELYPSVEHAYMSAKNDSEEWKLFCKTHSASEVKSESRKIPLKEGWEEMKLSVMESLLFQKFNNKSLADKLKATGYQNIQEGNTWGDEFWGVNLKSKINRGENHLGRLIMKVRDTLK